MKHRIIAAMVAALLGASLGYVSHAAEFPQACAEHLPYGEPTVPAGAHVMPVCHAGYAALVDNDALVPRWVAYHLTGPHTLGCFDRDNRFHPDEALPVGHRAKPADYAKSGFDIGHQAPAQDFGWDEGEMDDSFSLANMAPQLPGLNRAEWERLEESVRAWAWDRGDLLVYVGPAWNGSEQRIGPDHVLVPSAFWKVIIDMKTHEVVSFEMAQKDIPKGDLSPYTYSVGDIEEQTGLVLPLPEGALDDSAMWHAAAPWPADLSGWAKAHKAACGR